MNQKIKRLVKGLGIKYGYYGLKYKFYDTTSNYSRLKYGKEKFLKEGLHKIINEYKRITPSANLQINNKDKTHLKKFPVWFCWFQGLNNAPEIVKCCYNSVLKNIDTSKEEIHIITYKNITDYINIPNVINLINNIS